MCGGAFLFWVADTSIETYLYSGLPISVCFTAVFFYT